MTFFVTFLVFFWYCTFWYFSDLRTHLRFKGLPSIQGSTFDSVDLRLKAHPTYLPTLTSFLVLLLVLLLVSPSRLTVSPSHRLRLFGAGWLAGWLAAWLLGWLAGWLAGWQAGRLGAGLAGWLAGWLTG